MNKKRMRRPISKQTARNSRPQSAALRDERVLHCLVLVHEFFPEPEAARKWLNTPHPDFGRRTALDVLETQPEALLNLLSNARDGIPM